MFVDLVFQFWDLRSPNPALSLDLPERCYCMDVVSWWWYAGSHDFSGCCMHCHVHVFILQIYPMAVVGTASRGLVIYQLENTPSEFKVNVVMCQAFI